jgi:hypothetical protein
MFREQAMTDDLQQIADEFLARMQAGEFQTKLDWINPPTMPHILRKEAHMLSPGQLKSLPKLKEKYEAEMAAYNAQSA